MIAGVEFFLLNGEIQFIENGVQRLFCELDIALAARIMDEIKKDPKAIAGLLVLGITDPQDQIRQFVFCRFGVFDNVADVTAEGEFNYEYWDCGRRPCPADGWLCQYPEVPNGRLTRHEVEIIRRVAADQPNKMIADGFHRSKHTIDTQIRRITRKLGCHTKTGIGSFASRNNLVIHA